MAMGGPRPCVESHDFFLNLLSFAQLVAICFKFAEKEMDFSGWMLKKWMPTWHFWEGC